MELLTHNDIELSPFLSKDGLFIFFIQASKVPVGQSESNYDLSSLKWPHGFNFFSMVNWRVYNYTYSFLAIYQLWKHMPLYSILDHVVVNYSIIYGKQDTMIRPLYVSVWYTDTYLLIMCQVTIYSLNNLILFWKFFFSHSYFALRIGYILTRIRGDKTFCDPL